MDLGEALLEAWYQAWLKVTDTVPGGRHQKVQQVQRTSPVRFDNNEPNEETDPGSPHRHLRLDYDCKIRYASFHADDCMKSHSGLNH